MSPLVDLMSGGPRKSQWVWENHALDARHVFKDACNVSKAVKMCRNLPADDKLAIIISMSATCFHLI